MIRTPRLLLREWRDTDRAPFAALSADPRVMEFFPKPLSREESDAVVDRLESARAERGWGICAVEVPRVSSFIGFIGLSVPRFEAHFTPCVEVAWRLDRNFWGRGYATEGARGACAFGFDRFGFEEIVALAAAANVRSRRVMEKLGMTRSHADDFDHPTLPQGHPLQRHVLYRLGRGAFAARSLPG